MWLPDNVKTRVEPCCSRAWITMSAPRKLSTMCCPLLSAFGHHTACQAKFHSATRLTSTPLATALDVVALVAFQMSILSADWEHGAGGSGLASDDLQCDR